MNLIPLSIEEAGFIRRASVEELQSALANDAGLLQRIASCGSTLGHMSVETSNHFREKVGWLDDQGYDWGSIDARGKTPAHKAIRRSLEEFTSFVQLVGLSHPCWQIRDEQGMTPGDWVKFVLREEVPQYLHVLDFSGPPIPAQQTVDYWCRMGCIEQLEGLFNSMQYDPSSVPRMFAIAVLNRQRWVLDELVGRGFKPIDCYGMRLLECLAFRTSSLDSATAFSLVGDLNDDTLNREAAIRVAEKYPGFATDEFLSIIST